MDFFRSLRFTLLLSILPLVGAKAGGISSENKEKMLDSLRSYQPTAKSKLTSERKVYIESYCQANKFSLEKPCLELRYMNGEYFKVDVTYIVRHSATEHLPSKFEQESYQLEGVDLDVYLREWSDPIFIEYVGSDYAKFNNLKLTSLNNKYLEISFEIIDADELEQIVRDDRIVGIRHIAIPDEELEEIAN